MEFHRNQNGSDLFVIRLAVPELLLRYETVKHICPFTGFGFPRLSRSRSSVRSRRATSSFMSRCWVFFKIRTRPEREANFRERKRSVESCFLIFQSGTFRGSLWLASRLKVAKRFEYGDFISNNRLTHRCTLFSGFLFSFFLTPTRCSNN